MVQKVLTNAQQIWINQHNKEQPLYDLAFMRLHGNTFISLSFLFVYLFRVYQENTVKSMIPLQETC